ncbi:MAG TPA: pilus assembly protein PilM [Candidatus Paceibacterota bacterium]|nr:pilus assembly protein PilM [Candidatus Paceibacterota bacterium]
MKPAVFIKRAFPVPKLLVLSNVSVDITDGTLRYFEVSRSKGKVRPKAYGILPFPRIHMSSKEEKGDKALAEAAAALKSFADDKRYGAVRVVIHEGDAYVFKLKVPTMSPAEIRPAIESALEENVPIPPSEALFEYDVIAVDEVRGETHVAVSAVSEVVVQQYLDILSSGGLMPVSFETESRSLARALVPQGDKGAHAVLHIHTRHSVVFIVEKGKVVFSSSIEVGSNDLETAVGKTFDVSSEDAKALVSGAPASKQVPDAEFFDAMLPVFSTLRDELGKVIIYFHTEARKNGGAEDVADIILAGSAARVPGLARYVSLSSKVPAKVGSVWTNVLSPDRDLPDLDERSSLDYGSLIGAHL